MSSSYCCIEVKMPPRLKTTDSLSSKKAEILVPTNNITAWQIHIPYFELQPCGLSQLFSLCSASKLQWGREGGLPTQQKIPGDSSQSAPPPSSLSKFTSGENLLKLVLSALLQHVPFLHYLTLSRAYLAHNWMSSPESWHSRKFYEQNKSVLPLQVHTLLLFPNLTCFNKFW